ncbi:MAG TPA: YceI family protein [Desulfobacterales bacterium]
MKIKSWSKPPRYRRLSIAMWVLVFAGGLLATVGATADEGYEQLIVFLQPGASSVETVFETQRLPEVRELAREMGVGVIVRDAGPKAPADIAVTPLLVYQNHRGRSIYQGRTTTLDRMRNFIRTSRYVPQGDAPNRRGNIPVWQQGRARIWAPLKVSAVTGFPPPDYDHEAFMKTALSGIREGFEQFRFRDRVDLGRADRGFYMDFYPWLSEDGTLFLSLALYSQFHCKEPIFEKKRAPLTGPWKDRRALFREAARVMEAEVARHIRDPESGDSFTAVPADTPQVSWTSLDLDLPPEPPRSNMAAAADLSLPQDWTLEAAAPDDPPMLLFRFAAPLDQYAGEVTAVAGELHLSEGLKLSGARGFVEVDTRSSVTMGNAVLDEAIRGTVMLYTRKYPTARFTIDSIQGDGRPLAYGRLTPAGIQGQFTLKGTTVPLAVAGEFEPIVGRDGLPKLLVNGRFQIDLRAFDIEGADGPAPARHTLIFDINLTYGEMAAVAAVANP